MNHCENSWKLGTIVAKNWNFRFLLKLLGNGEKLVLYRIMTSFYNFYQNEFKVTHHNQTKIEASKLGNICILLVEAILWLMFQILKYWSTSWRHISKLGKKGRSSKKISCQ